MILSIRFHCLSAIAVLALLGIQLGACAPVTSASPEEPAVEPSRDRDMPASKVLLSEAQRITSPVVTDVDMETLVVGNSVFAFDFYQTVREKQGNLFYSPYSLSIALAMTYAGARGETETQMAETLHFRLTQDNLHPAFNSLDLLLTSQEEMAAGGDEVQSFRLRVANSIWGQRDYTFLPGFLDLLAQNYGAGLRLVDFASYPDPARLEINDWVAKETQDKIKDLIPEGAIDKLTRLVLANAIYFKADWMCPFEKELTQVMLFNLLNGKTVEAEMMTHGIPVSLAYAAGESFQAVELPYVGDSISMLILVPDAGKFNDIEMAMDESQLGKIISNLEQRMVILRMPKFKFESQYDLKDTLAEMGMAKAFDADLADFSGMDGTDLLYIGDVFHKAFVAVDEKGTEAAAATAVIVQVESLPVIDVELNIDRPFIFIIRDQVSGTILFIGRVVNPAG